MQIVLLNVDPVKKYFSLVHIVESHEQINKSTFATSRLPDQRNLIIWIDSDAESFEYKIFFSGRVPEPDILKLNYSL